MTIAAAATRSRELYPAARAVLYLRVSTEEQAKSGLGLEAQHAACLAYARDVLRLPIGPEHVDKNVSGKTPPSGRKALTAALADLQPGDVLLVAKRDRLARDDFAMAMIQHEVGKRSARIASAAGEGTDSEEPGAILMRRMIDAFSEHERLVIAARTKAALRAKLARGERLGAVPYGSARNPAGGDGLVPVPEEQAALAMIRAMRAGGASLRAIAAELTKQGIRPRRGKAWQASSLRSILRTSEPN